MITNGVSAGQTAAPPSPYANPMNPVYGTWEYGSQPGNPWAYASQPYDPRYGTLIRFDPRFGGPFVTNDPRFGIGPIGSRFGFPPVDPRFGSTMSTYDPRFELPVFGWAPDQPPTTYDPRLLNWGAIQTPGYGFAGPVAPRLGVMGLPKDDEIEEMAQQALDRHPLIPLDADVDVRCESGQVTLTGKVPDKRIKRAAGEAVWWIPGVTDVGNSIVVSGRRQAQATRRHGRQQPIQAGR